jgi:hypothetical protein
VYADCRPTRHVWDAVAAQLQGGEWGLAGGLLERRHIWLAQPPAAAAAVHQGVWDVVCLAAVDAMNFLRSRM